MAVDMKEFWGPYFEESLENLASYESILLGSNPEALSREDLDALLRAIHSVKGGSGSFGFTEIGELGHSLESHLERLRTGELVLSAEARETLLQLGDALRAMVEARQEEKPKDESFLEHALSLVSVLPEQCLVAAKNKAVLGGRELHIMSISLAVQGDAVALARAAISHMGRVLGIGQSAILPLTAVVETGLEAKSIVERLQLVADPERIQVVDAGPTHVERLEVVKEAQPKSSAVASSIGLSSSIRVGCDRVDRLINIAGELVIDSTMLRESVSWMDERAHRQVLERLGAVVRDVDALRYEVMQLRMVPARLLFARYQRIVAELSLRLRKRVRVEISGAETELDKGMAEKIVDPLTHLVRNAVDHGIELPDERRAAGKREEGVIYLSAKSETGQIVIEVSDDGRGLDRAKIIEKATKKGVLLTEGAPDAEVFRLIFEPGFTTKDAVSDVSGRGVGMDVVKSNVASAGGQVELHSIPGKGMRTLLRMPLTMAIIHGFVLRCGAHAFVLPVTSSPGTLRGLAVKAEHLRAEGRLLEWQQEHLPIAWLNDIMRCGHKAELAQAQVLIVESAGRRVALVIDEIVDEAHLVVKQVQKNFGDTPCVSGATILGDGTIAMILDPESVIRASRARLAA
jgi:two-component system, chemotaxis family, sensor kinase CheA